MCHLSVGSFVFLFGLLRHFPSTNVAAPASLVALRIAETARVTRLLPGQRPDEMHIMRPVAPLYKLLSDRNLPSVCFWLFFLFVACHGLGRCMRYGVCGLVLF